MSPSPIQPLAQPAPWHYHQSWAWSCDPGGKAFVPLAKGRETLSEGGFGVPGAGSPLSTLSWLSLAAPTRINPLLSPALSLVRGS